MNKNDIKSEFQSRKENYDRLGKNLVDALKTFLKEKEITFLDIYYRVKEFDSFFTKNEIKRYKKPFDEIEDICGIRIICYFASDIESINRIIKKEFNVLEEQDKSEMLGPKEFAYRSKHYIVKINNSWVSAPNYRKLKELKSEIQVRTILMHAWAEIEHKLNYKSKAQVPDKFKRTFSLLSAKLEEADGQFDSLRDEVDKYKKQLSKTIESTNNFNLEQDFNVDSFFAFLKFHFPNQFITMTEVSTGFNFVNFYNLSFTTLNKAMKNVGLYINEIINDFADNGFLTKNFPSTIILLAISLDIFDSNLTKREIPKKAKWNSLITKWRKKIKLSNSYVKRGTLKIDPEQIEIKEKEIESAKKELNKKNQEYDKYKAKKATELKLSKLQIDNLQEVLFEKESTIHELTNNINKKSQTLEDNKILSELPLIVIGLISKLISKELDDLVQDCRNKAVFDTIIAVLNFEIMQLDLQRQNVLINFDIISKEKGRNGIRLTKYGGKVIRAYISSRNS